MKGGRKESPARSFRSESRALVASSSRLIELGIKPNVTPTYMRVESAATIDDRQCPHACNVSERRKRSLRRRERGGTEKGEFGTINLV